MCQQQLQGNHNSNNNNNNQKNNNNKMKNTTATYSIKRVLKTLFKKQQQKQQQQQQKINNNNNKLSNSLESLESLDNLRNSQVEEQFYCEIEDNSANEKLADMVNSSSSSSSSTSTSCDEQQEDIYVPVRFARTTAGTFFWTTNLQPVTSTIVPAADEDLLQPAYCYSNWQYPVMQFQDRWAQA